MPMFQKKLRDLKLQLAAQMAAEDLENKRKELNAKKKDPEETLEKHLKNGLQKWQNLNYLHVGTLSIAYNGHLEEGKGSMTATMEMMNSRTKTLEGAMAEYPRELRDLLQNFISLPVSNARCERIFSHLKLLYGARHYNLRKETLKSLMFLGVNRLVPDMGTEFYDRQEMPTKAPKRK